jgi:hypothetical protein
VIDLVLQIELPKGSCEVWVEVKVHAGESGPQLSNYRTYIDAHRDELRRYLVVLSKDPLPTAVDHVAIRWRDVTRAVREAPVPISAWTDLVDYLEEIGMSEDATYPITVREASSLDDASSLLRKATTVLVEVNKQIGVLGFPDWMLTPTVFSTAAGRILEQLRKKGRLMLYAGHQFPATIFYGFVPVDSEVMAMVWIESNPKRTADRTTVREKARDGLDATWSKPFEGWQLVTKSERAISFGTEQEAVDWFTGRLTELEQSGLVALLPSLGVVPLDEDDEPIGPSSIGS